MAANPFQACIILPVVDETESLRETVKILLLENCSDIHQILIVMGKITKPEARAAANALVEQYPGLIQAKDQKKPFLGGAMQDAFEWASGTHLLMMASDLETNPHDVKAIFAEAKRGNWDIVTTTRWRGEKGAPAFEGYNPVKFLANWLFQKSFALLYGTELSDLTYGFRVFKMEWVKKIRWEELRHPLLLETMLKPLRLGARVKEIPTTWKARVEGESHNPFWRNFLYFRIAFKTRFRPERELILIPPTAAPAQKETFA
ncbi:glycosyltransferase [Bryobacter aggregatus]|uniref:glycosyltransferase n=1 Tax=Bryobacter aggregatus TaxID=360054 RepID=UPI00138E37AF|nr:glycosyltransferase [Bryobacter aggregatus]